MGIHTTHPSLFRADLFGIEMHHLTQRMDAGIRPSSGMGLDRRAMDLRDGML
jgi:hypothetical protein